MTFFRALGSLLVVIALVVAAGVHLARGGSAFGTGLLWGAPAGAITALTAIGGAWWAEARNLDAKQAMAVMVVGMLGRMVFLTAWAVFAVLYADVDVLGFVAGFGSIYLVGQALEVWMLARRQQAPPTR